MPSSAWRTTSGKIHERNTCRSPWINTFDARLNVGLPFKRVKAEITWDILNLINLFDSQNGLLEYANFNDLLVVRPTIPRRRRSPTTWRTCS